MPCARADELRRVVEEDVLIAAGDPGVAERRGARRGGNDQEKRSGRRRLREGFSRQARTQHDNDRHTTHSDGEC